MNRPGLVSAVAVALVSGIMLCEVAAQPPTPKGQRTPAERLSDLEQQVQLLQTRVRVLSGRVPFDWASLDCPSRKYDEFLFKGSHLVFLARCGSIEPYLEGHRVVIAIANPYAFNFSNVKGHLGYGRTAGEARNQKVEISTTELIRSGSWHLLTVIVNPSKAEDMRELILELAAETAGNLR